MTHEQKFELCKEIASKIVSSYRDEAPEGFDPQASWVAVAGLAISAGGAAYSASQQKKAASQAGAAPAQQKLQTYKPYLTPYEQVNQVNPTSAAQYATNTDTALFDQNSSLARKTNRVNYQEALKYYQQIQPYFMNLQNQLGKNAFQAAQGQLPDDVLANIQRNSANQGISGGFGYGALGGTSGGLANLNIRNLGLTSLQQQQYGNQLGMALNSQAKNLLPNLMSPADMFINPQMEIGAQEFNANAVNNVNSQNAGYINQARAANAGAYNALQQNISQGAMAGGLAGAQIQQQGINQIGGILGQFGANSGGLFGGSGGGSSSSISLPAGVSQSQYNNSMGQTAFNPNAGLE